METSADVDGSVVCPGSAVISADVDVGVVFPGSVDILADEDGIEVCAGSEKRIFDCRIRFLSVSLLPVYLDVV